MDPKKATKLDEIETLKLQNVGLKLAIITKERETLGQALLLKYGAEGERLTITEGGDIVREATPTPLVSVPEGA